MIVIATGFIPASPLSVVLTLVMWESTSGLERVLCGVLIKRTPGKHGQVHWPPRYNRNTVENGIKHHTTIMTGVKSGGACDKYPRYQDFDNPTITGARKGMLHVFLSSPLAVSETRLSQTQFGVCACVRPTFRCMCVRPNLSGPLLLYTIMYGFQNNVTIVLHHV